MPITPAQRTTALQTLLQNYGNDAVLGGFLPGLTTAQLVQAILGAIGSAFDAQLTTVLANLVTQGQQAITATQAGLAAMQAQVSADTVL